MYIYSLVSLCKTRNVDAKYIINASTLIQSASDFKIIGDTREVANHSQVILDDIFNDVSQVENIPIMLAIDVNGYLIKNNTYLRGATDSGCKVRKSHTELKRQLRTFGENNAEEQVGFHNGAV
ncbi:hypothetical protein WM31_20545 [Burkholderia ubonensis]|nr:hypothetical protein WM31_20545 [Burkholderia ubonensis]